MTADELRAIRKGLGMSQAEFALHVEVNTARTVRRWEASSLPVPRRVVRLLELEAENLRLRVALGDVAA